MMSLQLILTEHGCPIFLAEKTCAVSSLKGVSGGRYDEEGDGKVRMKKRGEEKRGKEGRRVARITSDHSSELVPPLLASLFLPPFSSSAKRI